MANRNRKISGGFSTKPRGFHPMALKNQPHFDDLTWYLATEGPLPLPPIPRDRIVEWHAIAEHCSIADAEVWVDRIGL